MQQVLILTRKQDHKKTTAAIKVAPGAKLHRTHSLCEQLSSGHCPAMTPVKYNIKNNWFLVPVRLKTDGNTRPAFPSSAVLSLTWKVSGNTNLR